MAPSKKIAKISESSNKHFKFSQNLPEDVVQRTISFLPIQSVLQNRVLSRNFRNMALRSRDLDFSRIFANRRSQSEAVHIIENIFNQHIGSEIDRFVLSLNHIGVEEKILSWIQTCLRKNIQELVLDFSKSKKIMEMEVDFSAIKTLTVLKLHWCRFEIPNNAPRGLRLLRTLSLTCIDVTKEIIDAVFKNCIHLETLELIKCRMYGRLNIKARNHRNFKSLVVLSMPNLLSIILDAPTLECYKYNGYVKMINFLSVDALKEAALHYNRSYDWHYYDSSAIVAANMEAYTRVHFLTTTNIFLEALAYRYMDGRLRKQTFWFLNLKEFQIVFKAPTFCTLFDIAEFIKHCPNLQRVLIDINDFTFEPELFWMIHHMPKINNHYYNLETIKYVEIMGYKNHWHELDIVHFFVKNAPSLAKLKLTAPTNPNTKFHELDYARISYIKSISSKKDLIEFVQG